MSARLRVLIVAVLALLCVELAQAGPRWQQNGPDRAARASPGPRSVNDVIGEVENRYGGKVVGVQQAQQGEESMYRVRVLQRNGRVKTVMVPAGRRH